ncbi:MAG TPA: CDP-alcohol phosphatidyltransferase family protein [Egibacteraceae bacterium]|nr:CDP-alcohol phosphatidyltransferase family protein [Egibacteraceae bacterium]
MRFERVRQFQWGARGEGPQVVHDKVVTAANAISTLRLLGLPVFVWLMLGPRAYGWAFAVLAVVGATDWVDGYVARRFDQVTKLGKLLDPLIDRVLIATVAVTLLVAGMIPWWLVALVVGRDLALLAGALAVFRGIPPIPVTRTGKFATACLLGALPGLLLGHMQWPAATFFLVGSWGLAAAGVVAYYTAGVQYVQAGLALRSSHT